MAVEQQPKQDASTKIIPPTDEEVRAANALEYTGETKAAERVGKSRALRYLVVFAEITTGGGVLAGSAGGVKVFLDHFAPPEIHRPVDKAYHEALQRLRIEKSPVVLPNFDTTATEGVIGDNNILRGVSLETIQNAPQFDEEGNPLFLIPTPKKGAVSHFKKELSVEGILPDISEQVKAKGVKNIFIQDNISAVTPIPMPLDGYVFLAGVERNGRYVLGGIAVEFMTPNNTLDFVIIDADGDIRIEALVDAPRASPENHNGRDYQKGLFLKRGVPILRRHVDGPIKYFRQGGENGTLTTIRRIPGDITQLTIPDPKTGEAKLPEPVLDLTRQ